MKRKMNIAIIVSLTALLFALPAAAMGGGNVKGQVTAVGVETITIVSHKGASFDVSIPDAFDSSTLLVGDWVLVKGILQEDGSIIASRVKVVGGGDDDEIEKEEKEKSEGEGSKATNSAFCAEDKQHKPHPMAVAIAETFGADEGDLIGYFCGGHGFGAIMLALQTADTEGGNVADYLDSRDNGKGWGQIWKEAGLVGNEKHGASPPGHLKRPAHAGSGNPNK